MKKLYRACRFSSTPVPKHRYILEMAENDKTLGNPEYWDARYSKSDGGVPTHEWFRSFNDLEQFFEKSLFGRLGSQPTNKPLILHLGSGDSVSLVYPIAKPYYCTTNWLSRQTIPVELASRGYKRQLCVDFSTVVVQTMTERHRSVEGIEWKHMDVRNMPDIAGKSIDVAFDKGTLDAMIHGSPWSPPEEVKENTSKYLHEVGNLESRGIIINRSDHIQVHRVLKDDGIFLYITFRQPHFIKPLLNPDGAWDIDMQTLNGGGSFDYFGYLIQKAR